MNYMRVIRESILVLLLLAAVNYQSLMMVIVYGNADGALFQSVTSGEDELRYVSKMKEVSEGRWLMANPYLKEHKDQGFSPSGFIEWIPATIMRALNGNMALMLLATDLLWILAAILTTRFWLSRVVRQWQVVWCCMFIAFLTHFGGELHGLLRDVTPKFSQPLLGLYLLLLTHPSRASLGHTLLRGTMVGVMFYTYPYHWTLCFVTEGLFLAYRLILKAWSLRRENLLLKPLMQYATTHAASAFLPFAILATPLALAMRSVLSKPEFADFYGRYHIVYTRIPAAPRLQLILLVVLTAAGGALWYRVRQKQMTSWQVAIEDMLPLLLPIIAMLALLNSNIVTGKDPEWLGHGGRVIMPVVIALYAAVIVRIVPLRPLRFLSSITLVFTLGFTGLHLYKQVPISHQAYETWKASPERAVLLWLDAELPPERIVAAPRILSEQIPVFTSHSLYFSPSAHFFFVSTQELTDRYLGWVGLFPTEKEPTDTTATIAVFGNHPGAQWSKERTLHNLLNDTPFTKTMGDYIPQQDLRAQIDREHANPVSALTLERLKKYHVDTMIVRSDNKPMADVFQGFTRKTVIGPYEVWTK